MHDKTHSADEFETIFIAFVRIGCVFSAILKYFLRKLGSDLKDAWGWEILFTRTVGAERIKLEFAFFVCVLVLKELPHSIWKCSAKTV